MNSNSTAAAPRRMDWSNIGEGPAGMIADLVLANDVADYVRFRAVCRPWRQRSTDPRAHGILDRRLLPRKWVMLREEVAAPDRRRLLNVSTGQCVRAHLPELCGHDVCAPTVEGLLVLLNTTTYAVRLLNPLTRHVSDLPPTTALYPLYRKMYRYKRPAKIDPREDFEILGAGLADDATVAVVFSVFSGIQMLVVVKPGDEHWTLVANQGDKRWTRVHDISFSPAISFAGRFYCTTLWDIRTVDIRENQPPRLVVAAKIKHRLLGIASTVHMLDNDGVMLYVTRSFSRRTDEVEDSTAEARYFVQYKVSRVDLDARKTKPVHDLGGRAIFIGSECAISVSTSVFPTIKSDSVYLGKDHGFGSYFESTGPYKIVDGRGTTMNFEEGGGLTEACAFYNHSKKSVPPYGPHGIVDYLSQYVTKGSSDSDAEDGTTESDAE